jgi:hypothetical protein
MIKTAMFVFFLGAAALSAHAQSYTVQHLGNFDYVYGPGGYSGTGQRMGQFYYYNDNYGSGVNQRLGNFDYYNYTPSNGYGYDGN